MNILQALPYAKLQDKRQQGFITENYVCSPPALRILDEAGDVWALGLQYFPTPKDGYAFNILKNGEDTGEWATKLESG